MALRSKMTNKDSREILIKHYTNPQNKVINDLIDYDKYVGKNPSCGDELTLYIKTDNNIVQDIKFNGSGCSICCAAASILTEELQGLTITEVENKIMEFKKLVNGDEVDQKQFKDALAFIEMKNFPKRHKCVFLSWQAMTNFLQTKK